jgi:hypothetical protein
MAESRAPLILAVTASPLGVTVAPPPTLVPREVVIIGAVQGNIQCTDRLDIRSEGSLTGDVITHRISVEDGAFLKGGVQVRAGEQRTDMSQQAKPKQASAEPAKPATTERPKAAAAVAGT